MEIDNRFNGYSFGAHRVLNPALLIINFELTSALEAENVVFISLMYGSQLILKR